MRTLRLTVSQTSQGPWHRSRIWSQTRLLFISVLAVFTHSSLWAGLGQVLGEKIRLWPTTHCLLHVVRHLFGATGQNSHRALKEGTVELALGQVRVSRWLFLCCPSRFLLWGPALLWVSPWLHTLCLQPQLLLGSSGTATSPYFFWLPTVKLLVPQHPYLDLLLLPILLYTVPSLSPQSILVMAQKPTQTRLQHMQQGKHMQTRLMVWAREGWATGTVQTARMPSFFSPSWHWNWNYDTPPAILSPSPS
jgi:hypothetical protein